MFLCGCVNLKNFTDFSVLFYLNLCTLNWTCYEENHKYILIIAMERFMAA